MTFADYEDLVILQKRFVEKMNILTQMFPASIPSSPEIEFTEEQKTAMKDVDASWEKFRNKMREMGGLVD